MKHRHAVTIASLLSVLLFSLHWADDVVRGFDRGGLSGFCAFVVLAVWLLGALVLAERRWGLIVVLVASLLASCVPLIHMKGAGLGSGRIAGSSGAFFWVWTLLALGVTAMLSVLLSVRGLWLLRRAR